MRITALSSKIILVVFEGMIDTSFYGDILILLIRKSLGKGSKENPYPPSVQAAVSLF
jgi:hypothetical protein